MNKFIKLIIIFVFIIALTMGISLSTTTAFASYNENDDYIIDENSDINTLDLVFKKV